MQSVLWRLLLFCLLLFCFPIFSIFHWCFCVSQTTAASIFSPICILFHYGITLNMLPFLADQFVPNNNNILSWKNKKKHWLTNKTQAEWKGFVEATKLFYKTNRKKESLENIITQFRLYFIRVLSVFGSHYSKFHSRWTTFSSLPSYICNICSNFLLALVLNSVFWLLSHPIYFRFSGHFDSILENAVVCILVACVYHLT